MHQTFSSNKDIEFLIDFRKFDEIEFFMCAALSTRFIKHSNAQESPFILYFNMADLVTLVVLNELMDSDYEKPQRGKTRNWIKRRHERGYFNNIIQELRKEDRFGFREMFRMDVTDFENILAKISDLISPKERLGGTNPVQAKERLALTLRFLATGETFQSLSFQYRISLNAVSYIVKGCCKAIVERMASNFIKVPLTEAEWLDISKKFEEKWNFPHALGVIVLSNVKNVRKAAFTELLCFALNAVMKNKCLMKFNSNVSNT